MRQNAAVTPRHRPTVFPRRASPRFPHPFFGHCCAAALFWDRMDARTTSPGAAVRERGPRELPTLAVRPV